MVVVSISAIILAILINISIGMDLACQHALSLCHEELMLVYNIVIIPAQVIYTCIGMVHVSVNVTLLYQRELGMVEIIVISLAQI